MVLALSLLKKAHPNRRKRVRHGITARYFHSQGPFFCDITKLAKGDKKMLQDSCLPMAVIKHKQNVTFEIYLFFFPSSGRAQWKEEENFQKSWELLEYILLETAVDYLIIGRKHTDGFQNLNILLPAAMCSIYFREFGAKKEASRPLQGAKLPSTKSRFCALQNNLSAAQIPKRNVKIILSFLAVKLYLKEIFQRWILFRLHNDRKLKVEILKALLRWKGNFLRRCEDSHEENIRKCILFESLLASFSPPPTKIPWEQEQSCGIYV